MIHSTSTATRFGIEPFYATSLIPFIFHSLPPTIFTTSPHFGQLSVGKKQTIETLIREEALLIAKFLRKENKIWSPRYAIL